MFSASLALPRTPQRAFKSNAPKGNSLLPMSSHTLRTSSRSTSRWGPAQACNNPSLTTIHPSPTTSTSPAGQIPPTAITPLLQAPEQHNIDRAHINHQFSSHRGTRRLPQQFPPPSNPIGQLGSGSFLIHTPPPKHILQRRTETHPGHDHRRRPTRIMTKAPQAQSPEAAFSSRPRIARSPPHGRTGLVLSPFPGGMSNAGSSRYLHPGSDSSVSIVERDDLHSIPESSHPGEVDTMPSLTIASDNEEGDNEAEEDCHDDDESEDEGIDDTAADVEEIAPAADISSVPRRQLIEDQFFMEDVARIVVGGQNRRTIRCRHCIVTVTFSDTRVRMMNHLARKHDSLWALIAPTPRPLTTPATAAPKAPFDVFAASLTDYASGPNNVEASLGYQITTCITIPDLILNEYTELMTWVIKQSTNESFYTTAPMDFINNTVLNRRDLVDR